jgi:pyruvate,water dikinase
VKDLESPSRKAIQDIRLPDALQSDLLTAYRLLGAENVAVRSSGTAEDLSDVSFAGQQDTFLNVSDAVDLIEKIKACWASLWSDRAIAYRRDHGIDDAQLAMAVVVQQMIEPDVSGVMFTRNPTGRDELVIESNWGLGESVVSGAVTPDHFIVSRDTFELIRETVVTKRKMVTRQGVQAVPIGQRDIPSLQRGQVQALAQLGMQVEAFYQAPQDIEWALVGDKFYLLQARPITTLADAVAIEQLRLEEIETLKQKADEEGTIWSRFNLAEVLPAPLPMTWAVIKEFMSGRGGFGLMYRELGFRPSPRVDEEGVLDLICGRIYFNLSREAELYFHGFPLEHNFERLKRDPQKAIYPQAATNIKRASASFWLRLPSYAVKMVAADRKLRNMRRDFARRLVERIFPGFFGYVKSERRVDLTKLSEQKVIAKFHEWRRKTLNNFAKEALKATVFAGFSYQQLVARLQKQYDEAEAKDLAQTLIAGLEGDLTVETNLKMWAVAQGELTLEEFLEIYGHRAVGEFELAQPRWREDSSYVKRIVDAFRANPDANPAKYHEAQRLKRKEVEKKLSGKIRRRIARELAFTRRYMPFRETAKFYLMLGYELIRMALVELGRRHEIGDGIFYLTPNELNRLSDPAIRFVIEERRTRRKRLLKIETPDVLFSDALNCIGEPPSIEAKDEIHGLGVSIGTAAGEAYVLLDAVDARISGKGYILVCPSTDPAWTPLFLHAAGLVMERGGMLSHGAVVAREYGIPAVVNVPGATRRIQSGQRLRVDGNRGIVSILGGER